MRKKLARMMGRRCNHPHTLVVSSVGVRRTVCETCGHVSFTMVAGELAPLELDSGRRAELSRAAGL